MSKPKNGFGIAWPPNLHIRPIFFVMGYLQKILFYVLLFYVKTMSKLEALTVQWAATVLRAAKVLHTAIRRRI
jgi:hypothetical protein